MNLSRLTRLALAAALVIPAAAQAQVETLKFEGVKDFGGDKVGSAHTGAYEASRFPFSTPSTTFDIYCIDMRSQFPAPTGMWNVALRDLRRSRSPVACIARASHFASSATEKVWGLAELRAAAYLGQPVRHRAKQSRSWDEHPRRRSGQCSRTTRPVRCFRLNSHGCECPGSRPAGTPRMGQLCPRAFDDKVFSSELEQQHHEHQPGLHRRMAMQHHHPRHHPGTQHLRPHGSRPARRRLRQPPSPHGLISERWLLLLGLRAEVANRSTS